MLDASGGDMTIVGDLWLGSLPGINKR